MVVTLMCTRGPASHIARGWKTLQMHGFLHKHMGNLQRAIILILRCESKFPCIKSLVLTHSACPCKIIPPSAPKPPRIRLFNYLNLLLFLLYLVCNFSTIISDAKKQQEVDVNSSELIQARNHRLSVML